MTKKEMRKQQIVESARTLFIKNGIEQTPFTDIASEAGVGEATVYRHFENKTTLAMTIAMNYVDDFATEMIIKLKQHTGTHLDKFEQVLNTYIDMFSNKPDYFIFLEHFDNYVVKQALRPELLTAYEDRFDEISRSICDFDKGEVLDDSIHTDFNKKMTVYTFNITFISLCQKLLLRGRITHGDVEFNKLEELTLMKNVMINSLKN